MIQEMIDGTMDQIAGDDVGVDNQEVQINKDYLIF